MLQRHIQILVVVQLSCRELSGLGVDRLDSSRRARSVHAVVDNCHGLVTIEEVRVGGVHVACLHVHHVGDELVRGCHSALEVCDHNGVELVLQSGVSLEGLDLEQELSKNDHELVVHEAAALETWLLKSLDLLLDNDFESCRPDEKGRCGTLSESRKSANEHGRYLVIVTHGRVVEDCANVTVLDLIEGVDALDSIAV